MRKVLFDSSFLMSVSESPTDWKGGIEEAVGGFEPVLLDCVERELTSISARRGKKAKLAGLALRLASGFDREPCGSAEVDHELVSSALASGAAVATVDRELVSTLRALHIEVLRLGSGRVKKG